MSGKHSNEIQTNQHASLRTVHMCVRIIVYNCCTQYSTEQLWLFSSQPPGNRDYSSDSVYWTGGSKHLKTCKTAVNSRFTKSHIQGEWSKSQLILQQCVRFLAASLF